MFAMYWSNAENTDVVVFGFISRVPTRVARRSVAVTKLVCVASAEPNFAFISSMVPRVLVNVTATLQKFLPTSEFVSAIFAMIELW